VRPAGLLPLPVADVETQAEQLARFVKAFQRGVRAEMVAMRDRLGAFEIALDRGREFDPGESSNRFRYAFELADTNEKLAAGVECSLRSTGTDELCTIESVADRQVVVAVDRPLDLSREPYSLVIYPWFLYERLLGALAQLGADHRGIDQAMALFGKGEVRRWGTSLVRDHGALNPGQRAAVQLCSDASVAFVWGPPGTGKTTTLAHVVDELVAQGLRVLLVSTTNAALDHALGQLTARPEFAAEIEAGHVVRIGQTSADTFGAHVDDVVQRVCATHRRRIDELEERVRDSVDRVQRADRVLADLSDAEAVQQSLFSRPAPRVATDDLTRLFPIQVARKLANLSAPELAAQVRRRKTRYARRAELSRKRQAEHERALRNERSGVVARARCVLATLTNAYLSPLMNGNQFDIVIAEEASMAVLPSLFYAACLATRGTVMVGDPRQLPPIVQSDDEFVRRVMGRNIFDVTVPQPETSALVAMLDTQYRMHPAIGDLVSNLFYSGRLVHGDATRTRDTIATAPPLAGEALVIIDTGGQAPCERPAGTSSRRNETTAELCADLARRALDAGDVSVGIISPYALQAREIRSRLAGTRAGRAIECSTIHRFQGQECDVIILDLVDSDPMRPGRLLSDRHPGSAARHLLNVSLSRARGKLILVADVDYFARHEPDGIVHRALSLARTYGRVVTLANT